MVFARIEKCDKCKKCKKFSHYFSYKSQEIAINSRISPDFHDLLHFSHAKNNANNLIHLQKMWYTKIEFMRYYAIIFASREMPFLVNNCMWEICKKCEKIDKCDIYCTCLEDSQPPPGCEFESRRYRVPDCWRMIPSQVVRRRDLLYGKLNSRTDMSDLQLLNPYLNVQVMLNVQIMLNVQFFLMKNKINQLTTKSDGRR